MEWERKITLHSLSLNQEAEKISSLTTRRERSMVEDNPSAIIQHKQRKKKSHQGKDASVHSEADG